MYMRLNGKELRNGENTPAIDCCYAPCDEVKFKGVGHAVSHNG